MGHFQRTVGEQDRIGWYTNSSSVALGGGGQTQQQYIDSLYKKNCGSTLDCLAYPSPLGVAWICGEQTRNDIKHNTLHPASSCRVIVSKLVQLLCEATFGFLYQDRLLFF
jgi:hypothetical protein